MVALDKLLRGVPDAYRTVTAEIRFLQPEEAGGPTEAPPDGDEVWTWEGPVVREVRSRLLVDRDSGMRSETLILAGEERAELLAVQGDGRWWTRRPGGASATGTGVAPPSHFLGLELFRRAWWLEAADVATSGTTVIAGRQCIHGTAGLTLGREGASYPSFLGDGFRTAAIDVDLERGVLMRVAGMVGGVETVVCEVTSVVFDVALDPGLFVVDSATEEFVQDTDQDRSGFIELEEAQRRVDFPIVLPVNLGTHPGPLYVPRSSAEQGALLGFLYCPTAGLDGEDPDGNDESREIRVWLTPDRHADNRREDAENLTRNGRDLTLRGDAAGGWRADVRMLGTHAEVVGMDRERILEIAATLEPVIPGTAR